MRPQTTTSRQDHGTTLIEVLISVGLIGIVMGALMVMVTAVIKLSPAAEGRDDDARTLLSLTAYMPEDVNSTPAGGYEFGEGIPSGCAVTHPVESVNLVRLTWSELIGTITTDYTAAYRYEQVGGIFKVYRYTCVNNGVPKVLSMSAELPPIDTTTWTAGSTPVAIVPHETFLGSGIINGVTFNIDTPSGDAFSFEMRTNDINEVLPAVNPFTNGVTPSDNVAPTAQNLAFTVPNVTPVTVFLPGQDANGDGMTVEILGLPASWVRSTSGLQLTITPPSNWNTAGYSTQAFQYRVTDSWGESAIGDLTATYAAIPPSNTAPTAGPVSGNVQVGQDTAISLDGYDADGSLLQYTWATPSTGGLTITVLNGVMTVSSDGTDLTPTTFNYTVEDDQGATATSTVSLTFSSNPCNVTGLTPTNATAELKNNGYLKNEVSFTVSYTGDCNNIVLAYDNLNQTSSPDFDPIYIAFGNGTIATLKGNSGGQKWTAGTYDIHVRELADSTAPNVASATLTLT